MRLEECSSNALWDYPALGYEEEEPASGTVGLFGVSCSLEAPEDPRVSINLREPIHCPVPQGNMSWSIKGALLGGGPPGFRVTYEIPHLCSRSQVRQRRLRESSRGAWVIKGHTPGELGVGRKPAGRLFWGVSWPQPSPGTCRNDCVSGDLVPCP